jgi:hypothetical protein
MAKYQRVKWHGVLFSVMRRVLRKVAVARRADCESGVEYDGLLVAGVAKWKCLMELYHVDRLKHGIIVSRIERQPPVLAAMAGRARQSENNG